MLKFKKKFAGNAFTVVDSKSKSTVAPNRTTNDLDTSRRVASEVASGREEGRPSKRMARNTWKLPPIHGSEIDKNI